MSASGVLLYRALSSQESKDLQSVCAQNMRSYKSWYPTGKVIWSTLWFSRKCYTVTAIFKNLLDGRLLWSSLRCFPLSCGVLFSLKSFRQAVLSARPTHYIPLFAFPYCPLLLSPGLQLEGHLIREVKVNMKRSWSGLCRSLGTLLISFTETLDATGPLNYLREGLKVPTNQLIPKCLKCP